MRRKKSSTACAATSSVSVGDVRGVRPRWSTAMAIWGWGSCWGVCVCESVCLCIASSNLLALHVSVWCGTDAATCFPDAKAPLGQDLGSKPQPLHSETQAPHLNDVSRDVQGVPDAEPPRDWAMRTRGRGGGCVGVLQARPARRCASNPLND